MSFSDSEKQDRLRLIRSENVGPVIFARLIERYGKADKALAALPELAKRGGKTQFKACPPDDALREMEQVDKYGAKLVFKDEDNYPALLAEIEDAPPVLTLLGDIALLSKQGLGVVGARNASLAGRKIAENFSQKVGQAGYVITSGLARGIDTAAHQSAMATGTVAVVAGGIDVIYPRENETLYKQIAARGAIVAESPFGTEPIARHFPRRNRIISGLSLGVLVVEAADKSGSLITARMAVEQNRDVFAVPGSPLDPRAAGTNGLLRDGAILTTSADDILQVLQSLRLRNLRDAPAPFQSAPPVIAEPDDKIRARVMEALSPVPTPIDEIIRATGATPGDVLTILLELELAGRAERQPGNKVILI